MDRQADVAQLIARRGQGPAVQFHRNEFEILAVQDQRTGIAQTQRVAMDHQRRGDMRQGRVEVEFERDPVEQEGRWPVVGASYGDDFFVAHRHREWLGATDSGDPQNAAL